MKKTIGIVVAVVLMLSLVIGLTPVSANLPSAKATAKISDLTYIGEETDWEGEILSQRIKVPSQKDLFVDVSLQCGLYTDTTAKSKGMVKDTSMAQANVSVKVEAYNEGTETTYPAMPSGWVIFADRYQELSATLQGAIDYSCVLNNNGTPDDETDDYWVCTINSPELTEEEIQLVQNTMSANAFNFVIMDLPSGIYTVKVYAKLAADNFEDPDADAWAAVGWGSVTIETVRMIMEEDVIDLP